MLPAHPDRTLDVQRLVPPDPVGDDIEERERSGRELEFRERQTLACASHALQQEPGRLEDDERPGERVAFAPVHDLIPAGDRILDLVVRHESLDVFEREHLLAVGGDETAHGREESVHA